MIFFRIFVLLDRRMDDARWRFFSGNSDVPRVVLSHIGAYHTFTISSAVEVWIRVEKVRFCK